MLVLVVLSLVILLGFAGLVIDIGRVYVAQRELQQAVDAAALAAGQDLPDSVAAHQEALAYGATGSNRHSDLRASAPVDLVQVLADVGCRRDRLPERLDERLRGLLHAHRGLQHRAGLRAGVGRHDVSRDVPVTVHNRFGHVDGVEPRRPPAAARRDGRARHDRVDAKRRPVGRLPVRPRPEQARLPAKAGVSTLLSNLQPCAAGLSSCSSTPGPRPRRPDGFPAAHERRA